MGAVWKSHAKMTTSSWVPLVGIACYPYVSQKKNIDKSSRIVLHVNAICWCNMYDNGKVTYKRNLFFS